MRVLFCGGARTVTGSAHVIELNGKRVLLECGLFQGHRREAFERNRRLPFPFEASGIDAMILSHAHIDHSGAIPVLPKHGYAGPIFCTDPTRDLCAVMLRDAAYIQEQDAEYLNRKLRRSDPDAPLIEPLYTQADVDAALDLYMTVSYGRPFTVVPGVMCTLWNAGHVLGSAIVQLDLEEDGRKMRLVFSGDLGRKGMPLERDPVVPEGADALIIESTYGGRLHDPIEGMEQKLAEVVRATIARGGKLIVPSFSLERTQGLVYSLNRLIRAGTIPAIPIYVDSPLSVNITEIFKLHAECFDPEVREEIRRGDDPFGFRTIHYVSEVQDSIAIQKKPGPAVIVSASGMCEAGRILHHLKNNVEDSRNTILVIGFMAQHTLGRRIVERRPKIRIFGVERDLNARVEVVNSFSAHADQQELLDFVRACGSSLTKVHIVHGDEAQSQIFAEKLKSLNHWDVSIPAPGSFAVL